MELAGAHARGVNEAMKFDRTAVTGMNAGETHPPRRLTDNEQDDVVHFDGRHTRYELVPHEDGFWMIRMFDQHGHSVFLDLPRGEAWEATQLLVFRMERRQFELPHPDRWVGKTPI